MEGGLEEELLLVETQLLDIQDQIEELLEQRDRLQNRQSHLKSLLHELQQPQDVSTEDADDAGAPHTHNDNAAAPREVPAEYWSGSFNWDSRADDAKFNVFGIASYRPNQREIINAVMSGRDVLVIMAAGSGKSLCYQLPAILHDGMTLVVSPLLSLIQDQADF